MARWANEDAYDAFIASAVARAGHQVTVPLVKSVIAVESGFSPKAHRAEPHIGDASRGLMQILFKTASGLQGWRGSSTELYDPELNIRLGTQYLSDRVRAHGGDVLAGVSAYNNGHGRRATALTTVCLARDTQGKCIRSFTAQPGQFLNQPYVDKVLDALRYFGGEASPSGIGGALGIVALIGATMLIRKAGII